MLYVSNCKNHWIVARGFKFGETMNNRRVNRAASERVNIPNNESIRESLLFAVRKALMKDWDLIALGCHEQAIAHRIALYLETRFAGFNTDCEYNRKMYLTKTNSVGNRIRPDILVHKRLSSVNVLAVEIKVSSRKSSNDPKKLKDLVGDSSYLYRLAAFIRISNSRKDIKHGLLRATIQWYEVGPAEINECSVNSLEVDAHIAQVRAIYADRRSQNR